MEIYFEEAALPLQHNIPRGHHTEDIESLAGVVGYRVSGGREPPGTRWYNHMPAVAIREQVGREVWSNYFKFCAIRNPFDKAVSFWWHRMSEAGGAALRDADFSLIRSAFCEWVCEDLRHLVDRGTYMIDGKVVMDDIIRYETLSADIARISSVLGLPAPSQALGRYKGEFRKNAAPFADYYDAAAAQAVRDVFGFELEYFGYQLTN
ncbi:hypothetical protein GCM10007301_41470 [Azorhizobium oxalatiphilum]|uniref:Sulfotransferase family protein n=1 Tax=Azorhizobium oxalatiphilum TaxID=980631 RepID=A0A917CAW5_9HYPH|nr:hypothetical protein GCM10007301_41470 [Azorhizobium oxalatiphilum]